MRLRAAISALGIGLGLGAPMAVAKPPVRVPPADFVESAAAGEVECGKGMKPQLSRKEFRTFALRNQVWPQQDDVDLSARNWRSGRLLNDPRVELRRVDGLRHRFKAQVYVLVGADGEILDRVVTCTNEPAHSESLLKLVDSFRFQPSRYKGSGLNTMIPVNFGL